jgi:hypothetical protein
MPTAYLRIAIAESPLKVAVVHWQLRGDLDSSLYGIPHQRCGSLSTVQILWKQKVTGSMIWLTAFFSSEDT